MVYSPGAFISEFWLDFPVSMGGCEYPKDPEGPIVMSAFPIETPDASGLPPRDQFRVGRARMLERPFAEYESAILEQMNKVWGPYGMDARRDVAALTVNRWPHGYSYSHDPLWDPPEYDIFADTGPHVMGSCTDAEVPHSTSGTVRRTEAAAGQPLSARGRAVRTPFSARSRGRS